MLLRRLLGSPVWPRCSCMNDVVFVKVCGVTRVLDAVAAAEAGVDAIGLNFVSASSRCVDVDTAREVAAAVRGRVMLVGVFRDQSVDDVLEVVELVGLDGVQIHGTLCSDLVDGLRPLVEMIITVVSVGGSQVDAVANCSADVVMLDGPNPGSGVSFDWELVGNIVADHTILLAGGLRPDNVAEAIRHVRPWGVDVASGVEVGPGRKDPDLMARFVAAARSGST